MASVAWSSRLSERLRAPGRIVALTGAGVSAESGLATFRGPGGLWRGRQPLELATPEAFERDPLAVWEFYDWRRSQASAAEPNPAHRAFADLETSRPGSVVLTQNVDGLHERAGCRSVIRLHGSLWRVRCTREGTETEDLRASLAPLPPRCACGALLRPGVVWFGEPLPADAFRLAEAAAREASVFLVVGTSSVVYPAASLPRIAAAAGAYVVEVNPETTPLSGEAHERLRGRAGELMPHLAAEASR